MSVAANDDVLLERLDSLAHAPLPPEVAQLAGDDGAEQLGRGERDGEDPAQRQRHREHAAGDRDRGPLSVADGGQGDDGNVECVEPRPPLDANGSRAYRPRSAAPARCRTPAGAGASGALAAANTPQAPRWARVGPFQRHIDPVSRNLGTFRHVRCPCCDGLIAVPCHARSRRLDFARAGARGCPGRLLACDGPTTTADRGQPARPVLRAAGPGSRRPPVRADRRALERHPTAPAGRGVSGDRAAKAPRLRGRGAGGGGRRTRSRRFGFRPSSIERSTWSAACRGGLLERCC